MNKYLAAFIFTFCLITANTQAQEIKTAESDSLKVVLDSTDKSLPALTDSLPKPKMTKPQSAWSFGLNGGYSYRLPNAGTRSDTPYSKYLRGLKTGFSIGADGHKFFWPRVGLGLKYNFYKSKGEYDADFSDDISIQFVGPSFIYQSPFENGKTSVLAGFAMGYQSYKNSARAYGEDFTLRGSATGWAMSLGLEQKLSEHFALNLTGACYLGTSYKFRKQMAGHTETIKLTRENFEDLSRIEITLGLKFLH
ncbi:outer membrane beta-barrel protein [Dyadobacter subterraneus]|uniref:Outer membrane beta-barrel protein n=1 Tax=Dyadobacter subterraneus TaxID=2773304 RepID=A0ABR9W6N5_9BACT|nr:outer membrane beta-barrel protein [Dyadobacter subterraneus]MBE9461088.1 outer membrane beta-barrel protein [Dyadobacter subterraneus]